MYNNNNNNDYDNSTIIGYMCRCVSFCLSSRANVSREFFRKHEHTHTLALYRYIQKKHTLRQKDRNMYAVGIESQQYALYHWIGVPTTTHSVLCKRKGRFRENNSEMCMKL